MKKIFFIIIYLFSFISLYPQNPEWIVYNTSNSGLINNHISVIVPDSYGNVYIGCLQSLVKYDGYNWTVYTDSGLGNVLNGVFSLAIDSNNCKWIGTSSVGLLKFNDTSWTVYNTSNSGLPDNEVRSLAIDNNNIKWIGTENGLAKFDGANWTVYNTSNSPLPSNYIYAIAIDDSSNLWIGAYLGGLVKYDGTNWTIYNTLNSGLPSDLIICITIDGSNNKWIGTYWSGLAKFDGTNWEVFNNANWGVYCLEVNTVCIDSDNVKWIGLGSWVFPGNYNIGGLVKYNGIEWTVYDTSNTILPDNYIESIAIDGYGNKWIGTIGSGIAVYREGGVVNVEEQSKTSVSSFKFTLSQNFPNPFNPVTTIKYSVPNTSHISMVVYNILGREIQTLVKEEKQPGTYTVQFDGSNLSSGVYFYVMRADNFIETKKFVLLK